MRWPDDWPEDMATLRKDAMDETSTAQNRRLIIWRNVVSINEATAMMRGDPVGLPHTLTVDEPVTLALVSWMRATSAVQGLITACFSAVALFRGMENWHGNAMGLQRSGCRGPFI